MPSVIIQKQTYKETENTKTQHHYNVCRKPSENQAGRRVAHVPSTEKIDMDGKGDRLSAVSAGTQGQSFRVKPNSVAEHLLGN